MGCVALYWVMLFIVTVLFVRSLSAGDTLVFYKYHVQFQINQPTRCNNLSSLLLYAYWYVQLNMFWACSRPSAGAQWLQWQPLVLPSYRGDSRAVGRGRAGPTTTNSKHVQLHSKNTFEKLVHLVGFIIRIETYFNGFGWVFSTSIS